MKKHKLSHTGSFSPPSEGLGGGLVEIQLEGSVARINLNRPERHNALILELIEELRSGLGRGFRNS